MKFKIVNNKNKIMNKFLIVFILLFIVPHFNAQDKKVTYGKQSYSVSSSKSYDGKSIFQKMTISEPDNLYVFIVGYIKENKIKPFKIPKKESLDLVPKTITLEFVTYEGFNHCENVTRKYVSVNIGTNSKFIIHRDDFDTIMKAFLNGKHAAMIKAFLYNEKLEFIPTVTFEVI
jgi:hypothetical protein